MLWHLFAIFDCYLSVHPKICPGQIHPESHAFLPTCGQSIYPTVPCVPASPPSPRALFPHINLLQGIDQVVVKEIACNCTELVNLNLANLENIGRVAFQSFPCLSNLQTLDLSNNRNIDHNDMENVGKLTKLKTLLLKNCTRVSLTPIWACNTAASLCFLTSAAGGWCMPDSHEWHVAVGAHRHKQLSTYQQSVASIRWLPPQASHDHIQWAVDCQWGFMFHHRGVLSHAACRSLILPQSHCERFDKNSPKLFQFNELYLFGHRSSYKHQRAPQHIDVPMLVDHQWLRCRN